MIFSLEEGNLCLAISFSKDFRIFEGGVFRKAMFISIFFVFCCEGGFLWGEGFCDVSSGGHISLLPVIPMP